MLADGGRPCRAEETSWELGTSRGRGLYRSAPGRVMCYTRPAEALSVPASRAPAYRSAHPLAWLRPAVPGDGCAFAVCSAVTLPERCVRNMRFVGDMRLPPGWRP